MKFQKGHKVNLGKKNHLGFKHSEETKRKIGLKSKGRLIWNKGKSWSDEIKKRISQTNKLKGIEPKIKYLAFGKKHWNWIEDRTKLKISDRFLNDSRRQEWTKSVYLRDEFKCKIKNENCNGRIEAHHILAWRDYPELRYEVNNGITLCHAHHPFKRTEEKRLAIVFQELIKQ